MKDEPVSRRASARIVPPKTLQVALEGTSKRYVIGDISLGGLSVISTEPLAVGSIFDVTLTYRDVVIQQRLKTIHSRKCPTGWIMGCAFVSRPRGRGPSIEDLMDDITGSMLSFPLL